MDKHVNPERTGVQFDSIVLFLKLVFLERTEAATRGVL